jgi:hypothetical protein
MVRPVSWTAPVLVVFDTNALLDGHHVLWSWAMAAQQRRPGEVQLLVPQVRRSR